MLSIMDYLIIKYIHIVSSTILFGTGIGSAFYMFMANRRKEIAGITFVTRHVVIADWLFILPTVIIQLLTGIWLLKLGGFTSAELWVKSGIALYFFVGACWLPVVWIQIKMRNMAREAFDKDSNLPERYWMYDRWWIILGCLAFPAALIVFYVMVFKPV